MFTRAKTRVTNPVAEKDNQESENDRQVFLPKRSFL